jgi:hypothetical protein
MINKFESYAWKFRFVLYVIVIALLIIAKVSAFWPPDMTPMPHPIEIETYEDDRGFI